MLDVNQTTPVYAPSTEPAPAEPNKLRSDSPTARELKKRKFRASMAQSQKQTPVALIGALMRLVTAARSEDAESRTLANRDIGTFFQYYDGKEYGSWDESGAWREDAETPLEFAYSMPLVPAHTDAAKTLLLKTEISYEYEAKNSEAVVDTQVAEMCDQLAEEEIERIFTEDMKGREALYLLLAGKSYRHHYYAPNPLEPAEAETPSYSYDYVDLPGARVCSNPECSATAGKFDEKCPKCGNTDFIDKPGARGLKTSVKNQKVLLGENQMYVPNPLGIQHDLSATNINFSSVFIERDTLPREQAQFLYSQVFASNSVALTPEARMVRELERTRLRANLSEYGEGVLQTLGAQGAATATGEIVMRERVWLAPWKYANIIFSEDNWYLDKTEGLIQVGAAEEKPRGARQIPQHTFLGDVFPLGLFLCVVDGTIAEINGSQVGERWVKLIFGMRPSNADGSGLQRLRPLADMANDSTNLEFKILMDDAAPNTFIDRKYLSYLAPVGQYNLLDNLGDKTPNQVVHRLQGGAAHPALGVMNDRVQGFAQFLVGTFSSLGAGAPDIKAAGTATGVAAMAEEAVGRFLEAIMQRKRADIDSRYIVLGNIKRHSNNYQIKILKERFGSNVVERFLKCNLRQTVAIRAKKGTDQPKSKALYIAYMQTLAQAASQLTNHPQAQQILQFFSEAMDFPLSVGIGVQDKAEANRRIAIMREMAKQFNEKPLPPPVAEALAIELLTKVYAELENEIIIEQIAAPPAAQRPLPAPMDAPVMPSQGLPPQSLPMNAPPPVPAPEKSKPVSGIVMMQDHAVFMDTCKDFLMGEGAHSNNQVLKSAVQLMWKLHFQRDELKKKESMRIEAEIALVAQKAQAEFAKSQMPPAPPQPSPDEIAAQTEEAEQKELIGRLAEHEAAKDLKEHDYELSERAKDEDLKREMVKKETDADLQQEAAAPQGATFELGAAE